MGSVRFPVLYLAIPFRTEVVLDQQDDGSSDSIRRLRCGNCLLPLLALIFFLLAIARGVVTNLIVSQSSFGGFSFAFALGTRLVCLVRQVVEWTHLRVCGAITDGMMGPSAVAMTALRAVVLVTS